MCDCFLPTPQTQSCTSLSLWSAWASFCYLWRRVRSLPPTLVGSSAWNVLPRESNMTLLRNSVSSLKSNFPKEVFYDQLLRFVRDFQKALMLNTWPHGVVLLDWQQHESVAVINSFTLNKQPVRKWGQLNEERHWGRDYEGYPVAPDHPLPFSLLPGCHEVHSSAWLCHLTMRFC